MEPLGTMGVQPGDLGYLSETLDILQEPWDPSRDIRVLSETNGGGGAQLHGV